MQMTSSDMAWMKAQAEHEEGDTAEQAGIKALRNGYLPDSQGYKSFVSGFMELVKARE